jgi:flagellar biosynthesis protein FlhF
VTKLDEAYRHGVLLDLFASARTPVSYITCGQEVPDDIRPATLERLEDLLLGEH